MKYSAVLALLLILCACNNQTPESNNGKNSTTAQNSITTSHNTAIKSRVVEAGIYRLVRSGGLIDDPSTSTGKSVSKPVVELIQTSQRIPLIKSAQMYFQYRIWPVPNQPAYADIRRVLKHPPMTLPNGKVVTGSEFTIKNRVSVNQLIGYTGYGLDEDYEMVAGDWVFEIWYQNRKVVEQTFTTYIPDKTELAKLEPLLTLGNRVLGQTQSPENFDRFHWPRIVIGKSTTATQIPAKLSN